MTSSDIAKLLGWAAGILLVAAIAFVAIPFLFILATNDLFNAGIEHTFWHYVSFWVLSFVFQVAVSPVRVKRD